MNTVTWIKRNALYCAAGVMLAVTLFSAGCQATADFQGERVTAEQLEAKRAAEIRRIETDLKLFENDMNALVAKAQAEYDAKVAKALLDAENINAEAEVAAVEIEEKEIVTGEWLAFLGNLATTAVSGGTINADDTLKGGLGLVALMLGGGYLRKRAEDKGYDMGRTEAIDTVTKAKA